MLELFPQWWQEIWRWMGLAGRVLAVGMTLWMVSQQRRKPTSIVAWTLAFFLVPFVAPLLYFWISEPALHKRARRHRRGKQFAADRGPRVRPGGALAATVHGMLSRFNPFPARPGNRVETTIDGERWFEELFAAIAGARRRIWAEVYLIKNDATGDRFVELLKQKVAEGVEVHLLYDHFGSLRFHRRWRRRLRRAGVHAAHFFPLRLAPLPQRQRWHFRNHRKLFVIDDELAFTGGMNIGDHYRSGHWAKGRWTDLGVRIEGPVVGDFARVFREDWRAATGRLLAVPDYPAPLADGTTVQLVPGGPDDPHEPIRFLFSALVSQVRHSIEAVTPYFVPDSAVLYNLQAAAIRGVRVHLAVPRAGDSRLVDLATRSFFADLLHVEIEPRVYRPGMVHAKALICDGELGLVGSPNFDARSFRLNYELALVLYGHEDVVQLQRAVREVLHDSAPVTWERWQALSWPRRVAIGVARAFGPLM